MPTFRLLNDDTGGAVDTAIQPKLDALQIRATGSGSSGSEQPATAFDPWGSGRPFRMVEILSTGFAISYSVELP